MKWAVILLIVGGAAVSVAFFYNASAAPPEYRTVSVERGDLVVAISATGTVEPEEVVDVGAQVAGRIKEFGDDRENPDKPIDFGSQVEQGTVLARIDDAVFQTQVDQAAANLKVAQSELARSEALLRQAERSWNRAEMLAGAISKESKDKLLADLETAKVDVQSSKARIEQAQASLREAEVNLGYTTIISPVHGTVIDRRVNVGQTVVAGLNAPSLFLIAKDMTRMRVRAAVNEADIGAIHVGQQASLTVDAYPDLPFKGEVSQIRLNASMVHNVVTYSVIVTTPNPEGKLLPYMTANLQFLVARRESALLLPNQAFRLEPDADLMTPESRALVESFDAADPIDPIRKVTAAESGREERLVWQATPSGLLEAVRVETGLTDGIRTELLGAAHEPGAQFVAGIERKDSDRGFGAFVPKRRSKWNESEGD